MRVALLCNAYPPEFVGGTELVVAAQAQALLKAGHDVRVVCGTQELRNGHRPWLDEVQGVEVVRIAKAAVESSTAHWQFARIVRVVEEAVRGCDLAHVHHWSSLSGDLVRRLSKSMPVFLTLHDHFASCPRFFRVPPQGVQCPPTGPTEQCVECLKPLIGVSCHGDIQKRLTERWKNFRAEIMGARHVISPSRTLAQALAQQMRLNGADWQVIPHGLCRELQALEPGESRAEPLTVISFGNRSAVKGTLDLVRALASLPQGSARLILPGVEVEAGFDDRLRAAAGPVQLEFPGAYDGQALAQHAARADLAAFASRAEESYGLVVEEALALGLPTWVSDRGALCEVLADVAGRGPLPGGILPAEDPPAWAALFRELVFKPERLQDARRCVPELPNTAERAVQRLLELYGSALGHQIPCDRAPGDPLSPEH